MEFFPFTSDETYSVFEWLTNAGATRRLALIEEAFGQVESNELFEIGMDESFVLKQELASVLEEFILSQLKNSGLFDSAETLNDLDSGDSLCGELLSCSARNINFFALAEAILRHAGKWSPDPERPEIL